MTPLISEVGLVAHGLACLAFLALAGSLVVQKDQTVSSIWLATAALTTAVWAGTFVFAVRFGGPYVELVSPMETLRTAAWIAFLVSLLVRSWRLSDRINLSFLLAVALGFVFAAQLLTDLTGWFVVPDGSPLRHALVAYLFIISRLVCAIGALVLVHNVYSNAVPDQRWGVRFVCIGLGGFFVYDIHLYTLAALSGGVSWDLYNARGLVDALVVPLIALSIRRNRLWKMELQISREVVFHSLSLVAVGCYLIAMSLAAYGLKLVGGSWGTLLQVSFLFGTLVLAAVVLFSGRFRAWARVKINKHFFAYKYDYRQEWLRFIATLSGAGAGDRPLEARAIQAVCDIVDSPGGALWLPGEDGAFTLASRWNFRTAGNGAEAPDGALVRFLATRQRIIDFDELRDGVGDYDDLTLPDWAAEDDRAWLGVPLLHLDRLIGFLVIERSRSPRTLNWEDFDLLRTVGRQTASYIAEQTSQAALLEARQFEEFNRRFAFIMHDIKNLVSQLSLVARNAERFAGNPEFQKDMVLTIRDSVDKMNDLLVRLGQHNTARREAEAVDLAGLLAEVVRQKSMQHSGIRLNCTGGGMIVRGDAGRLEQVFTHLIQNAIDASGAEGAILVEAGCLDGHVRVQVADNGCGMSEEFIRHDLFKPFRSTKAGGFGIGAYEAREIVRSYNGRLDVSSRPGEGTVFTVSLPLA
ncbi:XrtA/PEP-CTERM system histidine kinase PrsK [Pedomonas sp. V897]|uniref:XrtA/PEP-CTERM system histidine kinase PrsK n=1 Tax=Pedomonas sp. V897 TaxID=3446482 RepID=UPI003EE089AE